MAGLTEIGGFYRALFYGGGGVLGSNEEGLYPQDPPNPNSE